MKKTQKKEIIDSARECFEGWRKEYSPSLHAPRACFQLSLFTRRALRDGGLKPMLQAGTCSWPRIDLSKDDGKMMTHYSYQWDPTDPRSALAMAMGDMPEMHVWNIIQVGKHWEVIDPTTRYLRQNCEEAKVPWLARKPPDFLWGVPPRGTVYVAEEGAMRVLEWMLSGEGMIMRFAS